MIFCPKCGSIMIPKNDNGKKILSCSCGYKDKEIEKATMKEEVKQDAQEIEVVDDSVDDKRLPITEDYECPKCKHGRAYFWTVQTRAGDEPETKFMKCEKCKHTWRDYN